MRYIIFLLKMKWFEIIVYKIFIIFLNIKKENPNGIIEIKFKTATAAEKCIEVNFINICVNKYIFIFSFFNKYYFIKVNEW